MTVEPLDWWAQNKMPKIKHICANLVFFNRHIPENTKQALSFVVIHAFWHKTHLESRAVGFPVAYKAHVKTNKSSQTSRIFENKEPEENSSIIIN